MEKISAYLIQSTVHKHGEIRAWKKIVMLPTYEAGEEERILCSLKNGVSGSSGVVYPYPVVEKISDEKKDKAYTKPCLS